VEVCVPRPDEQFRRPIVRLSLKFLSSGYLFVDFDSPKQLEEFLNQILIAVQEPEMDDAYDEAKKLCGL